MKRLKTSSSFLKKEPKNLCYHDVRCQTEPRQRYKSLLLLFFRKEDLPPLGAAPLFS
jgi:hypothetical protein